MIRFLLLFTLAFAPVLSVGGSILQAGADTVTPASTVTPVSIPTAPPLVWVGENYAAHYSDGVMEATADTRGYPRQYCQISYTETNMDDDVTWNDIGSWLVVESLVTGAWLDCQIMDMPRDEHYQGIVDRNIIIEFGWLPTETMCAIQYVGQEPPWKCPVRVWRRP